MKEQQKQKRIEQKAKIIESRKHLANVRVVQRNLVYVTGLPSHLTDDDVRVPLPSAVLRQYPFSFIPCVVQTTLLQPEYFGQYGKIVKIVVNRNSQYNTGPAPTVGAYVTFAHRDDASAAVRGIGSLDDQ